ncbi:MAG: glutathione S-transferase family protein [Paracoccaceae bacterium]|nr:glutathione S-transferase family protein [Paracoccaceae bacterium]
MSDLILHYAPDNASLIVRLVLEELRLPYRTRLVDRAACEQWGSAYRAINPAGLIPALETPEGVIFETAAILLWLADRQGAMAPRPDDPARADFLKWLLFTSNTLHAQLRMSFYPEKYVGPEETVQTALRTHLQRASPDHITLPGALALLDEAFARTGDAPLTKPTVLDYYIASLLRWCALYPKGHTAWFDINAYPALEDIAADLEQRPAVRAVQEAEGLGPTPFTFPRHAQPPEGSAT